MSPNEKKATKGNEGSLQVVRNPKDRSHFSPQEDFLRGFVRLLRLLKTESRSVRSTASHALLSTFLKLASRVMLALLISMSTAPVPRGFARHSVRTRHSPLRRLRGDLDRLPPSIGACVCVPNCSRADVIYYLLDIPDSAERARSAVSGISGDKECSGNVGVIFIGMYEGEAA